MAIMITWRSIARKGVSDFHSEGRNVYNCDHSDAGAVLFLALLWKNKKVDISPLKQGWNPTKPRVFIGGDLWPCC